MNSEQSPNDLIRVKEAAAILDCSPETVKRYVRKGKLRAIKLSETGPIKIYRYELDRMLRNGEVNGSKGTENNRKNRT